MNKFFRTSCLVGLAALTLSAFEATYHFEDKDATIRDSSAGAFHGTYIPSAFKDNDNNETTDPNRYHQPGLHGSSLGFFPANLSYATLPMPWKEKEVTKLCVSLSIKPGARSIQYIIGNKSDAGKTGFSLMLWGTQWRVGFGDGKDAVTLKLPRKLPANAWGSVSFSFDNGEFVFRENGNVISTQTLDVKKIAFDGKTISLGNYCTNNKKVYPGDCFVDDLVITDSFQALETATKQVKAEKNTIRAVCNPVDGAERHFNGVKTLNTFREAPVGATFSLYFDEAKAPRLELTLPDGVTLTEAFNSNHNTPDCTFPTEAAGKNQIRVIGLRPETQASEQITCMLEVSKDFQEGTVVWKAIDGETVRHEDKFQLKVLPLPPELPKGDYYAFAFTNQDIAFHNLDIFRRTAGLFKRSGLYGKGRYYRRDERRTKLDEVLLKEYGYKLWEISLWGGPQSGVEGCDDIQKAIDANGKETNNCCLRSLARNQKAVATYWALIKKSLFDEGTVGAVLDFEPWGRPGRECFCKSCVSEFCKLHNLPEDITPAEIKSKHSDDWARFWTTSSAMFMKMMADGFRAAVPGRPVWDYTYAFPYDSEEEMVKRFWSIPKDPRLNETFLEGSQLSLYHINGRAAFDAIRLSRRHLKKDVAQISLISRHNMTQERYTTVEETLFPAEIYQKAVMCGALGHEYFGIYPGHFIDGSMHVALNNAIRDVRLHEDFYKRGKDITDASTLNIKAEGKQADTAWTIHEAGNRKLATLFNFSAAPLTFQSPAFGTVTVPATGVAFKEF